MPFSKFPRITRLFWAFILLGLCLILPLTAYASVTLVSFTLSQEDDFVRLDWETATELENAGFFILRNTTGGSDPNTYTIIPVTDVDTNITDTYIPPRGDLIGATYAFYDENVTPGQTYYYLLQAVDNSNNSEYYTPVPASLALSGDASPTPSLTPSLTATNPSGTPATPTATLTAGTPATATPTRTITPTPTRTRTPVPTFPPFNTATPTRTATPTPGPSSTFTPTFTVTPSPSVTLHPLDLTLTAVIGQVTPLPTYTSLPPTRTPFPTWTATSTPTSAPVSPGFFDGASSTGLVGLLLAALILFAGGGMLTSYLFLLRKR